jgi:hypothetical protein
VREGFAAALRFQPRLERERHLVAIGDEKTTTGVTRAEHDLWSLAGHRLSARRPCGQSVPFISARPLSEQYQLTARSRNLLNLDIFDFDFALNGILCRNQPAESSSRACALADCKLWV